MILVTGGAGFIGALAARCAGRLTRHRSDYACRHRWPRPVQAGREVTVAPRIAS
jgi:nucleoside-diphosphate-sugar epimerase